ncbi:Rieske (2Fe-2S) protein [Alicyclobacillus mengziensis]|uniref:Rieske (2Fe-2S) protein n=1 Tax=Alicyclobacillus mengziensis TaxID=2931921 RepID=A0A9X7Z965_9BACL|nr:Rieske (2Fe-2S) protein [Alicyclobacillus mengziensis]
MTMGRHVIGTAAGFPAGTRRVVTLEGRSVGIFNVHGEYYALKNACPHQGAPLCLGTVTGMTLPSNPGEYLYGREGEILRCPWHGWEFDLIDGKSIFNPRGCLVKSYEVHVESGTAGNNAETLGEVYERMGAVASVETYQAVLESGDVVVYI